MKKLEADIVIVGTGFCAGGDSGEDRELEKFFQEKIEKIKAGRLSGGG